MYVRGCEYRETIKQSWWVVVFEKEIITEVQFTQKDYNSDFFYIRDPLSLNKQNKIVSFPFHPL